MATKAFPTAYGFGKDATGGRVGKVIRVNTLEDPLLDTAKINEYEAANAGSLRWAFTRTYARIILITVSGWVELNTAGGTRAGRIDVFASMSNFTILGQFAPGKGLKVRNFGLRFSGCSNFIVRYIGVRRGAVVPPDDAVQAINGANNFILDHMSISAGWDETLSPYGATVSTFTVQNCLVFEGCNALAPAGQENANERHAFGSLFGGINGSWFRNAIAHFLIRNPSISTGSTVMDIRDSVFYNWISRPTDGGTDSQVNMYNNYYKPGPGTTTTASEVFLRPQKSSTDYGRYFLQGNKLVGRPSVDSDQKNGVRLDNTTDTNTLLNTVVVNTPFSVPSDLYTGGASANADAAYTSVLADVGMSLNRDATDERIISEITNGTVRPNTTWPTGQLGIIDDPNTVDGWVDIPQQENTNLGTSGDGIPDAWKIANGLNVNTNYGVSGTLAGSPFLYDTNLTSPTYGYRWIEIYSFSISDNPPTLYTLTVQSGGNGTVSNSSGTYEANEEVALTATANTGFRFVRWRRVSDNATVSLVANFNYLMPSENVTLEAVFEPFTPPPSTGTKVFRIH